MKLTDIIQVLRFRPAPSPLYHKECYTPQKKDVVVNVIRWNEASTCCEKCKKSVCNMPIVQLRLFEEMAS